ncbi:hypothetical protein ABZS93_18085 [Streptomyces sp900116325]|uniref:hypothetical protein n=1 Tax=Streptomyces sp. 900116325 TaxID=3154295 RepID=UPI0033B83EFC
MGAVGHLTERPHSGAAARYPPSGGPAPSPLRPAGTLDRAPSGDTHCHTILAADAPEPHAARTRAFRAAVADLGVTSTDGLLRRAGDVGRFLPRLWRTAEEILDKSVGGPAV